MGPATDQRERGMDNGGYPAAEMGYSWNSLNVFISIILSTALGEGICIFHVTSFLMLWTWNIALSST